MEWYFRDISDDPSEKELTQQDQFNNDEVALAEALVRETIQNSTDAQLDPDKPVEVRFSINHIGESNQAFFDELCLGLQPHLIACRLPLPSQKGYYLLIEDFNTTGLHGSLNTKDDHQFCGFWRRFGRSNKKGSSGGRWGLGKLVFSSSSTIRTLIGLTHRSPHPEEEKSTPTVALMGQAILKNHEIDSAEFDSVGFWCSADAKQKGRPSEDQALCRDLAAMLGWKREDEPGLSLAIPYLLPDFKAGELIAAVVKNYYVPILTGRLVVSVDKTLINAATFESVMAALKLDSIPPAVLAFVREMQRAREGEPAFMLPPEWQDSKKITGDLLGEALVGALRDRYKAGGLIHVRARLKVKEARGSRNTRTTYLDVFLKRAISGERGQTLVVRGSITVPSEGRRINLYECFAALVADEPTISQFLGDAENPAHTQWNERAEKLRTNWTKGGTALRRVRALLPELFEVIVDRLETVDETALADFFSIPPLRKKGTRTDIRPPKFPEPKPKPFRIERRDGGFAIIGAKLGGEAEFPMRIQVQCAYDVLNGNPFNRFSDIDFSFTRGELKVERHEADHWPKNANTVVIEARSPDFKATITGFDPNRDLIVEAQL